MGNGELVKGKKNITDMAFDAMVVFNLKFYYKKILLGVLLSSRP